MLPDDTIILKGKAPALWGGMGDAFLGELHWGQGLPQMQIRV